MNTEITIKELVNMINDHLDKGGLVMDAYRDDGHLPVYEAFLGEDWDGREDSVLCLRCPYLVRGSGSYVPDTDRLEVHGHEVHYFSTDYCGKVVFLNPAPVDLTARADADADATAFEAVVDTHRKRVTDRAQAAVAAAEALLDTYDAACGVSDRAYDAYDAARRGKDDAYDAYQVAKEAAAEAVAALADL